MKKFNVKELDFDDVFTALLEHDAEERSSKMENSNYTYPVNKTSPSSAGACLRLRFFREAGMAEEPSPDLLKIFYHGNLLHDDFVKVILERYFSEVLRDKSITIFNEYPLKGGFFYEDQNQVIFGGYIDNLIMARDPVTKKIEYIPIEVKSIGGKFKKLKEPLAMHKMQVMYYLYEMKAEYGYVVYVEKGTLNSKTYKVEYNQYYMKNAIEREQYYVATKKAGNIPEPEAMLRRNSFDFNFTMLNDQCKWCEFHDNCVDEIETGVYEEDDPDR